MSLLIAEDLALGYEGRVIVDHLNFHIDSRDYLCVVGENGSGKTTLMRTILGLRSPLSGKITAGDGLRQTQIGYLPQQTQIQRDFPASVREVVLSGCQGSMGLIPFYRREDKKRAAENLAKMGLSDLSKRCYRELSGGQQQRVLLARALCVAQKMLLLDEPVSGLDPNAAEEMYDLIAALNDEGITVMMISHDIDAALTYGSHILHIADSVFFGSKEEYLNSGAAFALREGGARR